MRLKVAFGTAGVVIAALGFLFAGTVASGAPAHR